MKLCFSSLGAMRLPLFAGLACLGLIASASQNQTSSPAKPPGPASVATNTAEADSVIPQSVFLMPAGPQEGKDPFFPHSTRVYASTVILKTNLQTLVVAPVIELHLQGTAGTAAHPLAIINNHTFAAGEDGDLMTPSGRVRVRCLEIKPESVVVLVGGERRTLRLRPGL